MLLDADFIDDVDILRSGFRNAQELHRLSLDTGFRRLGGGATSSKTSIAPGCVMIL